MYALRCRDDLEAGGIAARFVARRGKAMASFIRAASHESHNAFYDIAVEVRDQIAETSVDAGRVRLVSKYDAATSLTDAIYGGLGSRQRDVAQRHSSISTGRPPMIELLHPAPSTASLRHCRIAREGTPEFAFVTKFRDMAGPMTYPAEVAPNGTPQNPRLPASAPHTDFVWAP